MKPATSSDLYIGVDLGTSGCRAIVINIDRDIVAESSTTIPVPLREGAYVEQDPAIWWQATYNTLSALLDKINKSNVRAIAVDGTSGTVLLADGEGAPLANALMYNDGRATQEAGLLNQIAPASSAAHGVSSGLAKALWLSKQAYAKQSKYILSQSDWITARLSNIFGISDQNNCLKMGYDPVNQNWPAWLDKTGIDLAMLPRVLKPGDVAGTISPDMASSLGLVNDVSIIAGTTDSTAAFIATDANQPGDAVTSLGSTLVMKTLAEQPVFSPAHGVYSQPVNDLWLVGGGSNSGGAVLLRYFDNQQIQKLSARVDPEHATGLDYYPLVSKGERFPINDPNLEPRLSPRPKDDLVFFQAILEGIAKIEHEGYKLLNTLGVPYPTSIRSVGGGAKNMAWQKIRARCLGTKMLTPTYTEAAYGAALLAIKTRRDMHD